MTNPNTKQQKPPLYPHQKAIIAFVDNTFNGAIIRIYTSTK